MNCPLCKKEVIELTWEEHIKGKEHQEKIDEAVKKVDGEEKHGFTLTEKGITRF